MEPKLNYFCEDKIQLEQLLLDLSEVLKDTDAQDEKTMIQDTAKQAVKAYRVMVIGERESGRTSVLKQIFMNERCGAAGGFSKKTHGIEEICYGAAQVEIKAEDNLIRKFVTETELKGLLLTDIGEEELYKNKRVEKMSRESEVILAVFSSENIQNPFVWDFIERHCLKKKVICILNKSDLYPPEIVENKKNKLQKYMGEAGIEAPVFCMSSEDEEEEWKAKTDSIRTYIKYHILGEHPEINKQEQRLVKMAALIGELKVSFEKRSLQYEEDKRLLLYINEKMDGFYQEQSDRVQKLKQEVFSVVQQEISDYKDTIIKKMDIKKVQNDMDTSNKTVFMEWLQHEIDKREQILNQKVQNKVQSVLQWYYDELADTYEDITDQLSKRQQILDMDDRFYGTLQVGKHNAVTRAIEVAEPSNAGFSSLYSVTEDLYKKVKREKDRYEHIKGVSGTLGGAVGLVKGGMIIAGISTVPILFSLVLGTAGVFAAMQFFECVYSGRFEKNIEKHIREFEDQVELIKERMILELGERLELVFGELLGSVDKIFMPYRTTTNIDAKNIPLLEKKLESAEILFDKLMGDLEEE